MDPLDGDPVVLRSTGQRYRETATAIRAAVATLQDIARPGAMVSVAIDRVRTDAAHLADEVHAAESRYGETGEALLDYATALADAQERAVRAIADHDAATADLGAAQRRERTLRAERTTLLASDGEGAGDLTSLDRLLRSAGGDAADADAAAAAARRRYDDAVADRDRAARAAIGRIHDVVEGSDLNDSFWDDVGGVFHDLVDFLADALEAIVDAIVAVLNAIATLIVAVLAVIAAIVLLGLAILAVLVLALVAFAVLVLLVAAVLVVLMVAALVVLGLVVAALVLLAIVVARVLIGLFVFVTGFAWLFAVNLLRGMDPVQALVQAAIPALLTAFPELWAVIALASLQETGTPDFVDAESHRRRRHESLDTLFNDLIAIDDAGHLDPDDDATNHESVVRIIPFVGPDGEIIYRVHIPSTQQWTPGGTSGNDVTSDVVAKMNQAQQTQLEKMVIDAMQRAGIQPGDHVMLAGWSLGGITAGNLAADPAFNSTYQVDAIVVAGSSVDDLDIPHTTRVLDISHTTDPVPRTENPYLPDHSDDPNRYKIDVPVDPSDDLGHNAKKYQETVNSQVTAGGSQAGRDFLADDPGAPGGVQVSDYFGTPAKHDEDGNPIGSTDYAYTRGD
ncbi:hypothetical protein [Microbacterium sp. T2.11-28]|uniref:hypothetical protein n=1 Tax=Microbacterium sp. T2.11-28 TaxID=3041169 RepID=UPI0024773B72|nr:hypothetical protein [Microbacterium sp. T2.11-28]CAI9393620.1 hypothetical protein MICABA_02508 [Microbacterium sp. T2.11-28]